MQETLLGAGHSARAQLPCFCEDSGPAVATALTLHRVAIPVVAVGVG